MSCSNLDTALCVQADESLRLCKSATGLIRQQGLIPVAKIPTPLYLRCNEFFVQDATNSAAQCFATRWNAEIVGIVQELPGFACGRALL
eukprot:4152063-Amphidinium_carterae.1